MFRAIRSAQTKNGKGMEGVQFARDIAEYINAQYDPIEVKVFIESFGALNTVHWYVDYPDLATLERISDQLAADKGYWAMAEKGNEIFIEGSFRDTLHRST